MEEDNKGWVKAYRNIENDPIVCKDNDYFRVWHFLLYNASRKKKKIWFKNKEIVLNEGSLLTGRKKIAEKCNISESKVDRILKKFENALKIKQQTSNKNRLISINNWKQYQKNKQQVNNKRTTSEHKQEYIYNNYYHLEDNNAHACVYETFIKNICPIKEIIKEELDNWINMIQNDELIIYAIKIAVLNNQLRMSYISGILKNWKKENIKTIEDLKKDNAKKEEKIVIFDYDWLDDYEN